MSTSTTTRAGAHLACPFCGEHVSDKKPTGFYVHPRNGCLFDAFEFDEDSMRLWDTRVAPEAE
ncbi:hypothetical protein [Burkholderia plantarii]|uniref:hypothetical protein n=1 Tax=Burkholderia plantarii TaxID=41899 RepID=UPI000870B56D|nr:hypothetical protein [Burkholderia plantarii]